FLAYAALSFVALIGRRAEGVAPVAEVPAPPEEPGGPMSARAALIALSLALLLSVAGTVVLALRPVSFTVAATGVGPDGKASGQGTPLQWLTPGAWPDTAPDYRDRVAKLHEAAAKGQASRVAEMLRMGAAPDDKDDKGQTALMLAAEKGHTGIVLLLLATGA